MAAKPNEGMKWTIIGTAIAVIGLIIGFLAWVHPFSPTTTPSGVLETLTAYCNAAIKGDFHTTYNLQAKVVQHMRSERDFIKSQKSSIDSHGGLLSCNATDDSLPGRGIITFNFNDGTVLEVHNMLIMEDGIWKILNFCVSSCN